MAGCEVRRAPAPESTRQLRVAGVRRMIDLPALSPAVWSPEGTRFVFSADQGLYVTNSGGGAPRRISAFRAATSVSWSPTLDLLSVVDRGAVWTIRANGSERRRVDLPGVVTDAVWAPGGDRLAVVLRRTSGGTQVFELWLTSRTGGFRRMVARAPVGSVMREVQWFQNSLYLLYGLSRPGEQAVREVWQVRVANPDRHQIPIAGPATMIRLAPSGRAIAYVTTGGPSVGAGRVVASRPDGSGRFAVTEEPGRYSGLAWSPQGDKLAFAEVRGAHAEIWVADAEAGGRMLVHSYAMEFSNPRIALSLVWSPNGRRLLFGTNSGMSVGPIWMASFERR
jgi:Tol biopolymer transport system component